MRALLAIVAWVFLALACKEGAKTHTGKDPNESRVRGVARAKTPKPTAPKKAPGKKKLQQKAASRPRPAPPKPRWYRPTYRERGFYPPRRKLKRIPRVKPIPATIIQRGPRYRKWVALTFDACSWNSRPKIDRPVVRTLIQTRTPATLFVGGLWVLKRQKDAKMLASYPFFEIANHSYKHGHLKRVSARRLERELRWTQEIIYTLLGRIPTLFRPPYLEYDKRVAKAAGRLGLKTINGLASGDPDPAFTKDVLIRYLRKKVRPGSIVVLHMNQGGKHTGAALPGIIKALKKKGFRFVTVSKLLGQKRPM